jgi:hypothetical protein
MYAYVNEGQAGIWNFQRLVRSRATPDQVDFVMSGQTPWRRKTHAATETGRSK